MALSILYTCKQPVIVSPVPDFKLSAGHGRLLLILPEGVQLSESSVSNVSDDFVSLPLDLDSLLEAQTSHLLELPQDNLNLHEIYVLQANDDKISGHINRVSLLCLFADNN